jgi:serine/threonine protein phosphatase PrpC
MAIKITDNRTPQKKILFHDLKQGNFFILVSDGLLHQKLEIHERVNAVEIPTGEVFNIDSTDEVIPVNVEIILTETKS